VQREEAKKEKKLQYLTTKSWEIASAPGKQFAMTAFMMWMMGSGVHIMNIMFTFYQLFGPLQGLFKVNQVFKQIEELAKELNADLLLQKLVYIALQLGVLLYILNRFGNMGLLPTSAGDWVRAHAERPRRPSARMRLPAVMPGAQQGSQKEPLLRFFVMSLTSHAL